MTSIFYTTIIPINFILICINCIQILFIFICILIAVAFFSLAERKVIASVQRRIGPNIMGFAGVLQPFADGLKLFVKETIFPSNANLFIFLAAPILTFTLSLITWIIFPLNPYILNIISNFHLGIIYLFAISSLSVYGLIMAGWSSNSKYAFLGALRSSAQMISYEVAFGLIILTIILFTGSFNLYEIILCQKNLWFIFPLFPLFLMFIICMLAETNRHPFDLPEAEAELVAGYNVDYSSMGFALFFLAEYSNMIMMSVFITILFLGGWYSPFNLIIPSSFILIIKALLFMFFFILIRAILPRYRYDQLMNIGWKVLLPLSLSFFLFCINFLFFF
jgi:NADH-quinone oxidoreductase subunit H